MVNEFGTVINQSQWLAPLLMGLAGSAHCLSMCGGVHSILAGKRDTARHAKVVRQPVVQQQYGQQVGTVELIAHSNDAALVTGHHSQSTEYLPWLVVFFSLGRLLSYALAGLVFGSLVFSAGSLSSSFVGVARVLSAVLFIVIGLHIYGFKDVLNLERLGGKVWKLVQPFVQQWLPIENNNQAFLAGVAWGWMPCGMVYSVLAWSVLQGNPVQSALMMFLFGLGTLPAMLGSGVLLQNLSRVFSQKNSRRAAAILMIAFGLWSLGNGFTKFSTSDGFNATNDPVYDCR